MAKVFISGGMTGYHLFNRPAFDAKSKELHEQGHIVLNPASLPLGMEYEDYMRLCMAMIIVADAVYFLHGWQYSKGAREEFDWAVARGKQLVFEEPIDHTQFIKGDNQ